MSVHAIYFLLFLFYCGAEGRWLFCRFWLILRYLSVKNGDSQKIDFDQPEILGIHNFFDNMDPIFDNI